jgi:hypothetical protein
MDLRLFDFRYGGSIRLLGCNDWSLWNRHAWGLRDTDILLDNTLDSLLIGAIFKFHEDVESSLHTFLVDQFTLECRVERLSANNQTSL